MGGREGSADPEQAEATATSGSGGAGVAKAEIHLVGRATRLSGPHSRLLSLRAPGSPHHINILAISCL